MLFSRRKLFWIRNSNLIFIEVGTLISERIWRFTPLILNGIISNRKIFKNLIFFCIQFVIKYVGFRWLLKCSLIALMFLTIIINKTEEQEKGKRLEEETSSVELIEFRRVDCK